MWFIWNIRGFNYFFLLSAVMFVNGCAAPQRITPITTMPAGVYHIVGSGQTLWRIAKAYDAQMQELMRINHITDPGQLGVGQELFIPGARVPIRVEPYRPERLESIENLVGSRHPSSKWRYITLHHSATREGNAELFDRDHRRRRMGGLFYHFVIGNGSGSGDGEIEVGWRWRRQAQVERPNDIQICLVGDFNRQEVSRAQFQSLRGLVKLLCKQYNITRYRVRKHKDVKGKATECPGDNFPFYGLLSELK